MPPQGSSAERSQPAPDQQATAHSDALAQAGFQAIEVTDDSARTAREAERYQKDEERGPRGAPFLYELRAVR